MHLVFCVRMGASPVDPDLVSELATRAYDVNPSFPVPLRAATNAKQDLGSSDADLDSQTQIGHRPGSVGLYAGPVGNWVV